MRLKINKTKLKAIPCPLNFNIHTYLNWTQRGTADASRLAEFCQLAGIGIDEIAIDKSTYDKRSYPTSRLAEWAYKNKIPIKEVAKRIGVSPWTVYTWLKRGSCGARAKSMIDKILQED